MGENGDAGDLQDAVERSYRAQWGGRRFCLITAVVLFVLAVLSAVVFVVARDWFGLNKSSLKAVELCALTTSFVCLLVAVMSALEGLIRWQREKGQFPDRTIHAALCLSAVTLAGLAFLFFLFSVSWAGGGIGERDGTARVIRFVVLLFSGFVWLGSVVMNSAGVTMLVTRRSDLLEVNNTTEGTALLFRKGRSAEIVKLSVAALIPVILFVTALLIAGAYFV